MSDLYIYTGRGLPSKEFQALCIEIDLSPSSSLKFNEKKKWAQECIEEGFKIVWDLNFGSLNKVDEAHFLTLNLALEHFINDILTPIGEPTQGVILFKGKPDFDETVLKMLQASLPEALPTYLLLETDLPKEIALISTLEHFIVAVTSQNMPYSLPTMGWGHCLSTSGAFTEKVEPLLKPQTLNMGFCLPKEPCEMSESNLINCRIIPEEHLTTSWDGLDKMIVPYDKLTAQGKRKIAGFQAAGGEVIII